MLRNLATASSKHLRGFADDLWRAARDFYVQNAFNDCAAISYYALLSIVPFLSLSAAVLGYLLGSSREGLDIALEEVRRVVPQFGPQLSSGLSEMVEHRTSIGAVSLGLTLWTSSLVFSSLQSAVDRSFGTSNAPVWAAIKPRLVALGASFLLFLGFLFNTVSGLFARVELPFARQTTLLFELPLTDLLSSLLLDMAIFIAFLLALPPLSCSWGVVLVAAITGTCGWQLARSLFSRYVGYAAASFSFTGSAAAAVIFMLWIYYATTVLLFSAQLAARIQRRAKSR